MQKRKFKHIDGAIVGKHNTPMYLMHKFWARKSHNIVAEYIKAYSKKGDIVLDTFSGSGVTAIEALKLQRKAIAFDYNPVMTFIARMTAIPINVDRLKAEFDRIKDEVGEKILKLYESKCPKCKHDASIIGTKWDLKTDNILEVRTDCKFCKRQRKRPTQDDIDYAKKIFARPITHWFPSDKLRYNDGTEFKEGTHQAGVDDIPSLFTHRNLLALAMLYDSIAKTEDKTIRDILKFTFTSAVAQTSKLSEDRPTRPWSSAWITHRYWIPPQYMEFNVWQVFASHFEEKQGVLRGKEDSMSQIDKNTWKEAKQFSDLKRKTAWFDTVSVFDLSKKIPPNSIDYCFTDPPYADSIQYFELSKLWASWLRLKTRSDEEIVVNPQQKKDAEYYFKQMRSAFSEIYKVLKLDKYLTVTFHNTNIGIFNMIIKAAEYSGFALEKIVYQRESRAGVKQLGQPYGSAIGDYYLRFIKLKIPKKLQEVSVTDQQYRRIVIDAVKSILAKRGQPTPYTFIINGLYPILSSYGYVLTDAEDIKKILKSEIGKEFILVDVSKGLLKGKAWYFKEPSKSVAFIDDTPLNERVEKAVIQVLSTKVKVDFDDILQFIFTKFPNALTPENEDVMAILQEYGEKTKDGKWMLKPSVKHAEGQHDAMVELLCNLGEMAGFSVYGDITGRRKKLTLDGIAKIKRVQEIDVLWYKDRKVVYEFEVENSTAITEAVMRGSNITYPINRFIVIPNERENFLAKKMEEPALKERIMADNWGFIRYNDLNAFSQQAISSKKINLDDFAKLNKKPAITRNSQMDEFLK